MVDGFCISGSGKFVQATGMHPRDLHELNETELKTISVYFTGTDENWQVYQRHNPEGLSRVSFLDQRLQLLRPPVKELTFGRQSVLAEYAKFNDAISKLAQAFRSTLPQICCGFDLIQAVAYSASCGMMEVNSLYEAEAQKPNMQNYGPIRVKAAEVNISIDERTAAITAMAPKVKALFAKIDDPAVIRKLSRNQKLQAILVEHFNGSKDKNEVVRHMASIFSACDGDLVDLEARIDKALAAINTAMGAEEPVVQVAPRPVVQEPVRQVRPASRRVRREPPPPVHVEPAEPVEEAPPPSDLLDKLQQLQEGLDQNVGGGS